MGISWCKALPGLYRNNRRGGCTLLTANHSPDGLTIPQTSQCRSVALSHCRTVPKICCVLQVSKVTLRSIEHWEDTLSVSVTLRHCSYPNLSHFVCCKILFQTQQRFVQLRDWNSGKQNMWEIPCWETCCVGNVWKCQVSTGKVQA